MSMHFIVFEGLDGSGKSSLIKALAQKLEQLSLLYISTREPGGTELGEALREFILFPKPNALPTPRTELLLYQAIRAQHVDTVIRPSLEKGHWILCDRFTASSIAFQSAGRSINQSDVESLNFFATSGLAPELTVLLDLTSEQALRRRENRTQSTGNQPDRIESENHDFHNKVRMSFIDQAQKNPHQWLVLDASLSPEELAQQLILNLEDRGWLS